MKVPVPILWDKESGHRGPPQPLWRNQMKRKALAVAGAGTAALALGAGLFAWSANQVTVTNVVAAGTSGAVVACTTDAINIAQDAAVWNGTDWMVPGATLTNSGVNGAQNCVGMTMQLTAYDAANLPLQNGATTVSVDVNGDFNEQVTLGNAVNMNDLSYWTVSIS